MSRPAWIHGPSAVFIALAVSACTTTVRQPGPGPGDSTDAGSSCGQALEKCCAGSLCTTGTTCQNGTCEQTRTGTVGQPCTRNVDCGDGGTCLPLGGSSGNVCTEGCGNTADCVDGWSCMPFAGVTGKICTCSPSPEVCDGLDNNCDGIVDNQPAATDWCEKTFDGGYTCVNGACFMPMCQSSADCLAGQVCDPVTFQCVENTGFDAGTIDAGHRDAGQPQHDAGPIINDAGPLGCTTKYDCPIGQACTGGHCEVPTSSQCTQDSDCARGTICSAFNSCVSGCSTSQDCPLPEICNSSDLSCEPCGVSNACPSNQICVGSGPSAACETAPSCTTTAQCKSQINGSVCNGTECTNCTSTTQCDVSAYGSTFVCDPSVALCRSPSCTSSNCNGTSCGALQACDPSSCTCVSTIPDAGMSCTNSDCNGLQCLGGKTCNPSSCTCQGGPVDAGPSCTDLDCNGVACTGNKVCNPSTCTCKVPPADAGPEIDGGPGDPGSSCTVNSDCHFAHAQCVSALIEDICTNACTTDADCSGGAQCCTLILTSSGNYCDYGPLAAIIAEGLGTCN